MAAYIAAERRSISSAFAKNAEGDSALRYCEESEAMDCLRLAARQTKLAAVHLVDQTWFGCSGCRLMREEMPHRNRG